MRYIRLTAVLLLLACGDSGTTLPCVALAFGPGLVVEAMLVV